MAPALDIMNAPATTTILSAHRTRLTRRLLAAALLVVPMFACTPEPELGANPELEAEPEPGGWDIAAKLQSCGLMSEGVFLGDGAGLDEATLCYFSCIAEASCEQLDALYCGAGDASQLDADCTNSCGVYDEPEPFVCDDGEQLPGWWECDFEADCADGSDEANCTGETFTCDDGLQIPAHWQCDEYVDCNDGSDERACAELTCG